MASARHNFVFLFLIAIYPRRWGVGGRGTALNTPPSLGLHFGSKKWLNFSINPRKLSILRRFVSNRSEAIPPSLSFDVLKGNTPVLTDHYRPSNTVLRLESKISRELIFSYASTASRLTQISVFSRFWALPYPHHFFHRKGSLAWGWRRGACTHSGGINSTLVFCARGE